jgi:hypothetical protein
MRAFTIVAFIAGLASLAGCVGSEVREFNERNYGVMSKPSPTAQKAIVYFYRISDNGPRLGRVNMSIDGREAAGLKDSQYTWCSIAPGAHYFRAQWAVLDKPLFEEGHFDAQVLNLDIAPNRSYYICYSIEADDNPPTMLEQSGLLGKALSKSHVREVDFISKDEAQGRGDLVSCEYVESSQSE